MIDLLLLVIILVLAAVIVREDFIVYIAYVMAGIFIWSRWIVPRAINNLKASRDYQNRTFLGEPVTVTISLVNSGRLPILWLQLVESIPPELRIGSTLNQVLTLGPGKHRLLRYTVRGMKRGYYRIGPMQFASGDLFGFQERRAILQPDYLTVYPRVIPLENLYLPSRLPFGTVRSRQQMYEDPSRTLGVRDYRFGDSLRLVNWKASAHSRSLLVRTHEPAISLETMILLDLNIADYSRRFQRDGPEWAIIVAASIASYLIAERQSVGLASNGVDPLLQVDTGKEPIFDDRSGRLALDQDTQAARVAWSQSDARVWPATGAIPARSGQAHLMQILERLARLEAASGANFSQYAHRASLHVNWGVTLVVIVPTVDAATYSTLNLLARASFNVVLLIVEPYADFGAIREQSKLLGFSAFHVASERDLRMWSRSSTGNHVRRARVKT